MLEVCAVGNVQLRCTSCACVDMQGFSRDQRFARLHALEPIKVVVQIMHTHFVRSVHIAA